MLQRKWLITCGIAVAVLAAGLFFINTGSELGCRKTGEKLTEAEFIENGIMALLERYPGSVREPIEKAKLIVENAVPYNDVEEFLSENPSCCSFSTRGADGFPMPSRSRSGEKLAGFVHIEYKIKYSNPSGGQQLAEVSYSSTQKTSFLLDACGEVQPVF